MHRLPASLAAVPSDRGAGILFARRRLDGGFFFQHHPGPDRPLLSCLSFVHRQAACDYPHHWHIRPAVEPVSLVVDGSDRAIAHSVLHGRTIAASPHPAAASALVLAAGLVRLSHALALPLLIDRGLADLVAWINPGVEIAQDVAEPCERPAGVWCGSYRSSETAMALAFARALDRREVAR